jgi:hypothetical protein
MRSKHSQFIRRAWLSPGMVSTTALVLICGLTLVAAQGGHVALAADDPVQAALEKARVAGSYRFSADVTQTVAPRPTVYNIGRSGERISLYVQGEVAAPGESRARIWAGGASVVRPDQAAELVTTNGTTYVGQGGEWEEVKAPAGPVLPQGNLLLYLEAVDEIGELPATERRGVAFQRYAITLSGPRLAELVRQQIERSGQLPFNVEAASPRVFQTMQGRGEVWISPDGYPVRQMLDLSFPDLTPEATMSADLALDLTDFGVTIPAVVPPRPGETLELTAESAGTLAAAALPAVASPWLPLAWRRASSAQAMGNLMGVGLLVALLVMCLGYSRRQWAYVTLSLLMILSMVVGPEIQSLHIAHYFGVRQARAAEEHHPTPTERLAADIRKSQVSDFAIAQN